MFSLLANTDNNPEHMVCDYISTNSTHNKKYKQLMKLTQLDLDFVIANEILDDETKRTILRLQKISNKLKDTNDNFCMCTLSERKSYKKNFYIYWNTVKNDIESVGL